MKKILVDIICYILRTMYNEIQWKKQQLFFFATVSYGWEFRLQIHGNGV